MVVRMFQATDLAGGIPRIENRRQAIDFFTDRLTGALGDARGRRADDEIHRRSNNGFILEVMRLGMKRRSEINQRQQGR